ncbi:putative Prominin (Prom) protein [Fasciola gigantica]|uniref:Putative Prominin (Prom) protein n=1 Tax=Fasciola gigantica TaxID=46835 RepID=A0A504YLA5_FASGI|nr:putative Prominin (Prom) protein [Fasciola gigantica]
MIPLSVVLIYILLGLSNGETSTSTLLQLRDSVQFSYSLSNLFLDLIRGNNPPSIAFRSYVDVQSSRDFNTGSARITFRSIEPTNQHPVLYFLVISSPINFTKIVTSYVGFGVCLVAGILFAILMPLIGFIFCCARCCCNCNRVELMDKKKDPCRRATYTVCLVILVTIQLVAVVLAFINHFLLHEALIHEDPRIGSFSQLNLSLIETEQSLDTIYKMSVNTSSVNVDDRKKRFMRIVDDGLQDFQLELVRRSNADQVTLPIGSLQSVVIEFDPKWENVLFLNEFNKSLVHLTQELPSIRSGLVETLDSNCPLDKHIKCGQLMQEAQKNLKVRYTLDKFQSDEVSALIEQLDRHRNDFQSLSEGLIHHILIYISITDSKGAWDDLVHSPETREKLARSFEISLREIKRGLALVREHVQLHQDEQSSQMFLRFVEFQFYGGIALLCLPVLIFLLFYLGLCFGTCGNRPYQEAGVCNRGVGANLLLAGVGFVFLFSTILMIVCTILFLFGGPLQTEFCRYLTGHVPDGPRKLDDYVHDSMQYLVDQVRRQTRLAQEQAEAMKADGITRTVHTDLTSFELVRNITRARLTDAILTRCENEPFVDAISGGQLMWPALYEPIQSILQELIDSFKMADLNQPLKDTILNCMDALERIKFLDSVDFSLAINQTEISLTYITDLGRFVAELRALNVDAAQSFIDSLTKLPLKLDELRGHARNIYIKLDGTPNLRRLIQKNLEQYQHNLSAVVNENAFWAGLGLALLLFIPGIIFSVKLASLYRKTEPYSPDYEEPDYISYHGFYMRPTSDYQVVPQ